MKSKIEYINWLHSLLLVKYKLVKFEIVPNGVSFYFGDLDYLAFYNISNESIEYYKIKNKLPYSFQKLIK